jgi:hypothetical protein
MIVLVRCAPEQNAIKITRAAIMNSKPIHCRKSNQMKKTNSMQSMCRSIHACVDRRTNPHLQTRRFVQRVFSSARALLLLLGLAALAVPTRSFAQAPTFSAVVTTYTGSSFNFPEFAAVGDFNGDGKLDALVTDGSTSLRLMLGNGNGTFNQSNVSVPGTNPGPVKAADLNGDGKLDAVLTSNGPGNSTVLINTGNDVNGVPQFTATNYPGGGRSVTVGDLNGDGRPDFIVGNAGGGLLVYLNAGAGAFTAGQVTGIQPSAGFPSVGPGVIADLNGDGKADYVVTSNQAGATDIFLGNGDGTLQAPAVIPGYAFGLAVADLNHDGRPDLLQAAGGDLMVHLNSGDGRFSAPPTLYSLGGGSVTTADINGDGNLDVVVGYDVVRLGDGNGAFGGAYLFQANLNARDVAVGDFNGDGKPDIGTVGRDDRTYGVLLNTTVFAPADTTPPVITSPANITVEATGPSGAVVSFTATAQDNVDGAVNVTASRPSGSTFPLGITTVSLSASDAAGNTATAPFTITVRDTTPPIISAPATASAEATSAAGAVVTFVATADDAVSGNVPVTANPPSGSTFAVGFSSASLSATDAAGNTASKSIFINVRDTTAPALTLPANQTIEATSAAGAVATFAASATDAVGVTSFTSSAASGSTFPIGTTTVTVIASDAAGNTSSGSFTVTVRDTTAPVISSLTASSTSLWPPNHKMVPITLSASASDAVGVSSLKIVSATSNEPDNGLGDGDTAGDIEITGALTLNLRAERSGTGDGRVYTIKVEAKDAAGNATTKTVTVSVPKSQGGK